jgi:integrase/recombinase XerD
MSCDERRSNPRAEQSDREFTIRDWYKSGVNPQSKLPYLATYLGHKDIRSTLVYLNITPELLQEAGERFRKNGATALQTRESML